MKLYQQQIVKTPSRCIWSNWEIGLKSFWFISAWFALESAPKPMKSDHKWKSQSGGPFFILQACFGGHLGVVFCEFCTQKGFSEAFFSVFPAFTNLQNPFPVQTHREGVLTICGFIVNAPGRGFGNEKVFWMSLKVVEVDKTKRQNTSPLQKLGEWPDNGRFWFFTVPLNFLMGS